MGTSFGHRSDEPAVGLEKAGGEPIDRVLRRKAFHLASIGAMALLAALAPEGVALWVLTGLLVVIFLVLFGVSLRPAPERHAFRETAQRKDKDFPLQGTVLSIMGAVTALLLFPSTVAAAALVVLALGDGLSTLYAVRFGRVRFPWSEKRADAWVFGVLVAAAGAALLVPWGPALVASAVAQVPEVFDVDDPPLWFDDNLVTPLLAGTALVLLGVA